MKKILLICPFLLVALLQGALIQAQTTEPPSLTRLNDCIVQGDYWSLQDYAYKSSQWNLDGESAAILNSFLTYLEGKPQEAIELIRPWIGSAHRPAHLCLKTRFLAAAGEVQKAIDVLQHETVQNTCLLACLASLYLSDNQLDEAIAIATKAIELDPESADALYTRGLAYWKKQNPRMAITDLENAMAIRISGPYRNEQLPHLLSGIYYSKTGQFEKCFRVLNYAIDHLPRTPPISDQIDALLWSLYSQSDRHLDAMQVAEKSLKANPQSSESSGLYAMSLIELKRSSEADNFISQWLEKSPNDVRAMTLLALVRLNQGKFQEAFELAEKSSQLAPLNFEAHENLINIGIRLLNSDQFEGTNHERRRFADKLCQLSRQLCEATGWKKEKHVELLTIVYTQLGREDELAQFPINPQRQADQNSDPRPLR